jgi:hypothetical protein
MSKTKNNELKFSIRNLIDITSTEKNEKRISNGIRRPPTNHPLKRLVVETQTPLIRRPVPMINQKTPHPCWSFLSQLANKNPNGNLPLNSSLIFLSKIWEQIQRTQISTPENEDGSDEDIELHQDIEIEDDDEEEEEEDECSSNDDDKLNPSSNSEETDKLKTYPCTQCGKVRLIIIHRSR